MLSERSKLLEKEEAPFYGSYQESDSVEEEHWERRKQQRHLAYVTVTIILLVVIAVAITLSITLPAFIDEIAESSLDPPNPENFIDLSSSVLELNEDFVVASDSKECSDMAKNVVQRRHGSFMDAAVTAALCTGIYNPQMSGIGGNSFMTIYSDYNKYAIDAGGSSPSAFIEQTDLRSHESFENRGYFVSVPGELSALWEAHRTFGQLEWSDLFEDLSQLAESGVPVSSALAKTLKEYSDVIVKDAGLREQFFDDTTGSVLKEGDILKRPRLAKTLRIIGEEGAATVYNGTIANLIEEDLAKAGGVLTTEDLIDYSAEWVEPVVYDLNSGLSLISMPFPSSGPFVAFGLGILQGFGKNNQDTMTPREISTDSHRLTETLRFIQGHQGMYDDFDAAERNQFLDSILNSSYAEGIRDKIETYKTFRKLEYYGSPIPQSRQEAVSTHVSIMDGKGNCVSLTSTINEPFGAGILGRQTGIIFNNRLKSSVTRTTKSNVTFWDDDGLEPVSNILSHMSPVVLINENEVPILTSGGSGGNASVPALISTIWRTLYRHQTIKEAIDFPRFVPGQEPQSLFYEYGLPKYLLNELNRRGHHLTRLDLDEYLGRVNTVARTKRDDILIANSDFRYDASNVKP